MGMKKSVVAISACSVIELVNGCVVGGLDADQQLLRQQARAVPEDFDSTPGAILQSAAAAVRERGEAGVQLALFATGRSSGSLRATHKRRYEFCRNSVICAYIVSTPRRRRECFRLRDQVRNTSRAAQPHQPTGGGQLRRDACAGRRIAKGKQPG